MRPRYVVPVFYVSNKDVLFIRIMQFGGEVKNVNNEINEDLYVSVSPNNKAQSALASCLTGSHSFTCTHILQFHTS